MAKATDAAAEALSAKQRQLQAVLADSQKMQVRASPRFNVCPSHWHFVPMCIAPHKYITGALFVLQAAHRTGNQGGVARWPAVSLFEIVFFV